MTASVDEAEIARFSAMAEEWWDPAGKFAPLHRFNPVRLAYIKETLARHFRRDPAGTDTLAGLSILDVGCGGGLLSEPLARLGARVTGIDASEKSIGVARLHAAESGLEIDYRPVAAEILAEAGERFDVVLAMEIVEHVPDVPDFIRTVSGLVAPGGLLLVATLNRTLKAWALAIVGAEYVLGWLPRGTHDWAKFVTPDELSAAIEAAGLAVRERKGVVYNPLSGAWHLSRDVDVNYMVLAGRD